MRTAVITVVHGRHDHLDRQMRGVAAAEGVAMYVVVAMDDPEAARLAGTAAPSAVVDELPTTPLGLPLAAARNRGAELALAGGADVLVFLDADCIPTTSLVRVYSEAAIAAGSGDLLLCGPVAYLPPDADPDLPADRLAAVFPPHPARPAPAPGEIEVGADHALFWSLSFAVSAAVWRRIGGFCEDYVGYGGEDTDFAATARARGIALAFVGGASAVHQFHPTANPPVQHLRDIVRNANLYLGRWGTLPMGGWLDEFERQGRIAVDGHGVRLLEAALTEV